MTSWMSSLISQQLPNHLAMHAERPRVKYGLAFGDHREGEPKGKDQKGCKGKGKSKSKGKGKAPNPARIGAQPKALARPGQPFV